ncbi:hypothetical protein F4553_001425 [Allocatelliglobosispora scoriae]|uniref:Uncharacterized protein n=1 Tax=Allocatelliglobosispora scoriae TaxID=643052 RepID=A0A841BLC1_9ACTN|nr:hypothetical protein [Allocatelliglobosispora scoriae]MBB5868046.1 hypothetical protein [Allocatelliglobosispora scoriae]
MLKLPATARAIADAATEAITAAQAADADAFDTAATQLAGLDREKVGIVLGHVIRTLLERRHPDGLDGDDIRAMLADCVRGALPWRPELDPHVLIVLLANALDIHEPDEERTVLSAAQVAAHAPLLVAHLVTGSRLGARHYVEAGLAEIARAETMEMP